MLVVMSMCNLKKYSDNLSKTSGILWQHWRDKPALDAHNAITDFSASNAITDSFKMKEKITGKTGNNGTKMLKKWYHQFLNNFWRTLEMPLISFSINLYLKNPL